MKAIKGKKIAVIHVDGSFTYLKQQKLVDSGVDVNPLEKFHSQGGKDN